MVGIKRKNLLQTACIALMSCASAQGAVINVPLDQPTIQDAIDAAVGGDEIVVAPGTYNEAVNLLGKGITLRSADGAGTTTIDAAGLNDAALRCMSGEGPDTVIQGFTVTGGTGYNSFGVFLGGGMYLDDSSPTVTQCVFTQNGGDFGAGMFGCDASPTVSQCTFRDNHAEWTGGGIEFTAPIGGSPTLTDCVITENTARQGGGISNDSTSTLVTDCLFYRNASTFSGGGGMENAGDVGPTVMNCSFIENTSEGNGAGMHNWGAATVVNTVFANNAAAGSGGAISNSIGSSARFINCTFSGNTSNPSYGAGAIATAQSHATVSNSILWGNTPPEIRLASATMTVSHSVVQGGYPGVGNVDADPLLFDPAGGNVRISAGSPCIDAGSNGALLAGVTTDLDDNARFVDDPDTTDTGDGAAPIVDMGAYEFFGECNANGIPDDMDLAAGTSADVNENGIPDECEDCNGNGVPDELDVIARQFTNVSPAIVFPPVSATVTHVITSPPGALSTVFVTVQAWQTSPGGITLSINGTPVAGTGWSGPFACGPQVMLLQVAPEVFNSLVQGQDAELTFQIFGSMVCGGSVLLATTEYASQTSEDCNANGIPDECDLAAGTSADCNSNGVPDECDLSEGVSEDCNANDIPDECDDDDCNSNGVPDECDVSEGVSEDCNANDIPDECEDHDCNSNGIPDECDIDDGASRDTNNNSIPDECEFIDCNGNDVDDADDLLGGTSPDCNGNFIPDECDVVGQPQGLFVLDSGSDQILRIDQAGLVSIAVTFDEITAATGSSYVDLSNKGIAVGGDGVVYFAEGDSSSILKRTPDGSLSILADYFALEAVGGGTPKAIAIGHDGHLYVNDDGNDSVLRVDPQTGVVEVYTSEAAMEALAGIDSVDLDGGIVGDDQGNIYTVSDSTPQAVFAIAPGGVPSVLSTSPGFGDLDSFISLSPDGDLIVVDDTPNTIHQVTTDTGMVTTFLSGADLEAAAGGEVSLQGGIAFDRSGAIYVAEGFSKVILRFEEGSSSGSVWVATSTMTSATGVEPYLSGGIAFGGRPAFSGDCNSNGVPDECDIASGASEDADADQIPDECQGCVSAAACPDADVNCDDVADGFDIAVIRRGDNWLRSTVESAEPRADANGDGVVDGFDIAYIRSGVCWLQ